MKSDCDFLAAVLSDGKPHTTNEILNYSLRERGCGLTVHSRISDLRKRGFQIECRNVGKGGRRAVFEYQQIGSLPDAPQSSSSSFGDDDPQHASLEAGRGASGSVAAPSSSGAVSSPLDAPEQISLLLPGSVYRKDVAA